MARPSWVQLRTSPGLDAIRPRPLFLPPCQPNTYFNAKPGDFAATVLMPGDPLRAQYIAEHYLEDARRVNDVRNMLGFTGT